MGAVKDLVTSSQEEAAATLCELQAKGVSFVLTSNGQNWTWYLPNLDVTPDQDDWIFHALRCGSSRTFVAAVMGLNAAVHSMGLIA